MLAKRRKIQIADKQFVFGVGVKLIAKYLVTQLPGDKGFRFSLVLDRNKRKSSFTIPNNYFIEGTTLYSHGLRMFPYNKKRDRQWAAAVHKRRLVEKLDLLSKIAARVKNAGHQRTIQMSESIDKALSEMASCDKVIKRAVKKYLQEGIQ